MEIKFEDTTIPQSGTWLEKARYLENDRCLVWNKLGRNRFCFSWISICTVKPRCCFWSRVSCVLYLEAIQTQLKLETSALARLWNTNHSHLVPGPTKATTLVGTHDSLLDSCDANLASNSCIGNLNQKDVNLKLESWLGRYCLLQMKSWMSSTANLIELALLHYPTPEYRFLYVDLILSLAWFLDLSEQKIYK